MRLALALCIVIGSTLVGRTLSGSARRRAASLKEIRDGVKVLRVHTVSQFEPVRDSLRSSGCQLLAQVGDRMGEGLGSGEAWLSAKPGLCRSGGLADALSASDVQLLDRMFSQLGQSGRETQEILLSDVLLSLDQACDSARTKAGESDRLYVSLGLLTGLMLALIVI